MNEMYIFLQKFFDKYPQFYKNQSFYIFGESYAGHYIPVLTSIILKKNNAIQAGLSSKDKIIPLKGIGIGDGWVSPIIQV